MKFYEIWNQLVRKNSKLENDDAEVTFKASNLKALLRQVYEQGEKEATVEPAGPIYNPFDRMFDR